MNASSPPFPVKPFDAPPVFHLLAKPTGAICNLDCQYCFFLSKEHLYPGSHFRMEDALLEQYIRQTIESQAGQRAEITLAWQGGEPTLMGLDFFKCSVELAEKYRQPGQAILHTIQTNGTKLDDEWAAFFKQHNFLVGLSVDGPKEIHDTYRVNKGGAGSFDQVMRGWEALRRHKVDFNILCTLHAANGDHPLEIYHFFRDELKAQFIQFIPIVERVTPGAAELADHGWSERAGGECPFYRQQDDVVTGRSIRPEQYGHFLSVIFDEWVRRDVGKIYVQMFDVALGSWMGLAGLCVFAPTCGNALALEHNGDLYACDHFVEPDYLLGNIQQTHLVELVASEKQRKFGEDKRAALPGYCRQCDVLFACNGGCPKDRFITTPTQEPGLNYLCAGYKLFFHHITRPMNSMANLLRQGRAPAEIMNLIAWDDLQHQQAERQSAQPHPARRRRKR